MKSIASTLLTTSIVIACLTAIVSRAAGAEHPPNLLLILADDLGYGDLSSYGAKDLRTPNIDALIAAGMRFDNFYANCPVCSPTRAALLTGRYPEFVGVPGVIRTHPAENWGWLSPSALLLPQLLKHVDYDTAIVGKWHLGLESPNTPNERGFDHFHGFLGDMMDDYNHHRRHGLNYLRLNSQTIDPPGHATDLFTQWSIDYIHERTKSKKPFFLYLAYNAPHVPIQPPNDWLERVKQRAPGLDEKRAKLVALIEHLDDGIGRVIAALKQTGLYDHTLIVFTSDNGGQLEAGGNNGALHGGKGSVYEGGLKVPMGAVWNARIKSGSRSDRIALTMDMLPTLCEAAGVEIAQHIDGVSILPTLLGRSQPPLERDLFWTRREGGEQFMGRTIDAIRRGDWKLLQNNPFAPPELYHLKDDPLEKTNLAAHNRKQFNELSAALQTHLQLGGAVPWQKP